MACKKRWFHEGKGERIGEKVKFLADGFVMDLYGKSIEILREIRRI